MTRSAVRCTLAMALLAVPVSAQTIRGNLVDGETGAPIDFGLVIMLTASGDSVTYSLSDSDGYFSITSPEPGSFALLASGLGYGETKVGIFDLGMGGELTVEFRLPPRPMPIDEIVVELDREALEHNLVRNGFVRRYQRNAGGRFITPHDLERSPDRSTEDLLRRVQGVHVRPVRNERYGRAGYAGDAIFMEGRGELCRPTVYVDGARIRYDPDTGQTLSSFVPLHTVQAVEVYRSPAEVPVEYNITRSDDLCGVLVIWTG